MQRRRYGRQQHQEEHENHERWLVSYADFITLLFAFFVVMYAVSSVNEGKYRVLSEVLSSAFRSPVQNPGRTGVNSFIGSPAESDLAQLRPSTMGVPDLRPLPAIVPRSNLHARIDRSIASELSPSPVASPEDSASREEHHIDPLEQVTQRLQEALSELIRADLVAVRRSQLWVEVEIKNNVLFPSGSATINGPALEPLERLAAILRDISNRIQVEGFTDDIPIKTPVYPSNWELSAARAASVVHVLMKSGVRPERMAAVGYGEFRPIGDNSTEEGRNRNRRVVLVILGDMNSRKELRVDAESLAAGAATLVKAQPSPEKFPLL